MEIGLSLGSNLGDRLRQLQEARQSLSALDGVTLLAQSPVYETEPVDVLPDDRNLFFLNAVLVAESLIQLPELLAESKRIERSLGRKAGLPPNAPRPIDIDIIYADKLRVDRDGISLPHPRWSSRRFVVQPLNDVRPDLILPGQTGSVAEVLRMLPDKHKVRLVAEDW